MANKILDFVLPVLKPIGVALSEAAVWFVKEFWLGLKAIFDNLVVLAVIIPLMGGMWTWDHFVTKEMMRQDKNQISYLSKRNQMLADQVTCLRAKKCR